MIKENELDLLHYNIKRYGYADLFYIAHLLELREGYVDKFAFKSHPEFKIVQLKLTGIDNAYWEYLNYKEHPLDYHTEEITYWYSDNIKYTEYYTIRNKKQQYVDEFNPQIPSIIYGKKRVFYKDNTLIANYDDLSFILPEYTNVLTYNDNTVEKVLELFNNGELDWKYRKLDEPIYNDSTKFEYVTSNYYILDIANFPRVEKNLISIKEKNAFFVNLQDAYSMYKELIV